MPKPFGFELSGMVALRKCFEPKCFLIREVIQTPLTLHSGVAQEGSKGNSIAMQGRIAYLILDIMHDKFVRVRIYKR